MRLTLCYDRIITGIHSFQICLHPVDIVFIAIDGEILALESFDGLQRTVIDIIASIHHQFDLILRVSVGNFKFSELCCDIIVQIICALFQLVCKSILACADNCLLSGDVEVHALFLNESVSANYDLTVCKSVSVIFS